MWTLSELQIAKEKLPTSLDFDFAEYSHRLEKVRREMAAHRLDLLILFDPENIRYLTGFHTFAKTLQCLLVPQEGECLLILRFLESLLTKIYSWVSPDNVIVYDDTEDPLDVVTDCVKRMKMDNAVIGIEGWYVPDLIKHRLSHPEHGRLFHATWRHADGIMRNVRAIKSEAELRYMQRAGRMSVYGATAGITAIHEGITDNEVAAQIAKALFEVGSEMLPHSPIVTSGWRSGIPHTTFERQRIRQGDTVLIELTGVCGGYVAPIMRSAVVGSATPKLKDMSAVLMEALHAALDTMRPGTTAGDVDERCREIIEKAGYYLYFRKRTGYSVGLGWPEHISLQKGDPTVLQKGMVFHLPVALRDYGKAVVGFSVTVAVTENGVNILTEMPEGIIEL